MAKMKEGSASYNYEAIELALSKVDLAPCVDCGHPVDRGFTCSHCGGGNGTEESNYVSISYKSLSNI